MDRAENLGEKTGRLTRATHRLPAVPRWWVQAQEPAPGQLRLVAMSVDRQVAGWADVPQAVLANRRRMAAAVRDARRACRLQQLQLQAGGGAAL